MASKTRPVLAIDIGGTKLAVGVVAPDGRILERSRCPTTRTADGDELFDSLTQLLEPLRPFDQFEVCGVGCGGPMAQGGVTVSPLNILAWRSYPLRQRLVDHTGLRVFVDNDAKALALAEGWVGGAVGEPNYIAMVVSTGVGGGIVLDGRLLDGGSGNAGHIGHVVVNPGGFELAGHVQGVLEAEASGTAIAAQRGIPAQNADHDEMVRVGTLVGQAVGSVANLLDLPLALVAGSVALGFGEPFFAAAQNEVDRICQLDYSKGTRIVAASCGDNGPLIGAAAVGLRGLGVLVVG